MHLTARIKAVVPLAAVAASAAAFAIHIPIAVIPGTEVAICSLKLMLLF
jgi:hypothetical protein